MTATADPLNGSFRLDLVLRGLDAPLSMIIDQYPDRVFVHVVLAEPEQVHAWAAQMGVQAVTRDPIQTGGGWWSGHTDAVIRRDGLTIQVSSAQLAEDRDALSMAGPVTP